MILRNPVYVGDLVAQKQTVAVLGSNKRKRVPKEETVMIQDNHPALISREQFQLVQNILSRRSFGKTKGNPNLFTNFIYCTHCGSGMYYTKRPYGNNHYVCGRYQKRGKHHCCRNPIQEDSLRAMILTKLRELTQAHVNAYELMEELHKEAIQEQKKLEKAETAIRKKVEKATEQVGC